MELLSGIVTVFHLMACITCVSSLPDGLETNFETLDDVTNSTIQDKDGQSGSKKTGFLILICSLLVLVFLTITVLMFTYIRRVKARMANLNRQAKEARLAARNYANDNPSYKADMKEDPERNTTPGDIFCVVKDTRRTYDGLNEVTDGVFIVERDGLRGDHDSRRDQHEKLNGYPEIVEHRDLIDEVKARPVPPKRKKRQEIDNEPSTSTKQSVPKNVRRQRSQASSEKYKAISPDKEIVGPRVFRTRPGSARFVADVKREQMKTQKKERRRRRGSVDDIEVVHTMDSYDQDKPPATRNVHSDYIGLVIGSTFDFLENELDTSLSDGNKEVYATVHDNELKNQVMSDDKKHVYATVHDNDRVKNQVSSNHNINKSNPSSDKASNNAKDSSQKQAKPQTRLSDTEENPKVDGNRNEKTEHHERANSQKKGRKETSISDTDKTAKIDQSQETAAQREHCNQNETLDRNHTGLHRRKRGESEEEWEERKRMRKERERRKQRKNETPEEREERHRMRRQNETPEERKERHRQYHERRRRHRERAGGKHHRHRHRKHKKQLSTLSEENRPGVETNKIKVAEVELNMPNSQHNMDTSDWETSDSDCEIEKNGPSEMLV